MPATNLYSDIAAIAPAMQEGAIFAVRELGFMQNLVTVFNDMSGYNPRKGYQFNKNSAGTIAEDTDLTSTALTPSLDQTLSPYEIALQYLVTDLRAESQAPESILADGVQDLGFAAADKVNDDLVTAMASLTGGTVGVAGTTISWGHIAAAIARARAASKSNAVPLACVMHGYQWAVLAKAASVAGATVAVAPGFQEEVSRTGYVGQFMGVPLYQAWGGTIADDDFIGGVFPRSAIAIDWRRAVRVEAQRDASKRATEFNMSAVYACGVWRPTLGIAFIADASAPES